MAVAAACLDWQHRGPAQTAAVPQLGRHHSTMLPLYHGCQAYLDGIRENKSSGSIAAGCQLRRTRLQASGRVYCLVPLSQHKEEFACTTAGYWPKGQGLKAGGQVQPWFMTQSGRKETLLCFAAG